jgi:RNA recognition motif-containing protein
MELFNCLLSVGLIEISSVMVLHSCFSEKNAKKVYVGGIPYYSSEDDIRSFFEACGSITSVDCMTFPESGKFRGIAILTFKVSLKTLFASF